MLDPRLNVERLAARPPATDPFGIQLQDGQAALGDLAMAPGDGEIVSVRMSLPEDHLVLVRLAALDSASLPPSPLLVGELGGSLAAAVSLANGEVVADPFRRTVQLVELLRLRARQLREQGERHGRPPRGLAGLRPLVWRRQRGRRYRRRRVPVLS